MPPEAKTAERAGRALWTRSRGLDLPMRLALLVSFGYHGGLLLTGSYRRTYDAYVHIFFADHYATDWFSFFEPRWYTGFSVASYPPASHQLVAMVSKATGLELAFVVVQTLAVVALVIGVFRFAQLWVDERAAGYAALFVAVSSMLAQTVHVFGQLPTVLALAFFLNGLPSAYEWIAGGRPRAFFEALALTAATAVTHHLTTIFAAVCFLGPMAVVALADSTRRIAGPEPKRTTLTARVADRVRRAGPVLARAGVLGVSSIMVVGLAILPYWLWGAEDPVAQVPIPHASRSDFLSDFPAALMFFIVPWGAAILTIPYVLWAAFTSRAWALGLSFLALAVLGLGDTTPVARLALGDAFDILTLDRFTAWAIICAAPLVGALLRSLWDGVIAADIIDRFGRASLGLVKSFVVAALAVPLLLTPNLTEILELQPEAVDPDPIVDFLAKDRHWQWRYLTLGFGDQMAWLAAHTEAGNVEGNYHSARRLPELVTSPVERLDGAKFGGGAGLPALEAILTTPETYGLKFVFSNDEFYDPLLHFSGWHAIERLDNGVMIWERADVPIPDPAPRDITVTAAEWAWGTVPLGAVGLGLLAWALATRHRARHGSREGWESVMPSVKGLFDAVGSYLGRLADEEGLEVRQRRRRDPSTERRGEAESAALRISIVAGVAALGVVMLLPAMEAFDRSPERVAADYWQALADRDLEGAHETIHPAVRPTLEEFRRQRALDIGLTSSYSILEAVQAGETVVRSDDAVLVDLALRWLTPFGRSVDRQRTAVERAADGRWYVVVAEPEDLTAEPAVERRPAVTYVDSTNVSGARHPREIASVQSRPLVDVTNAGVVVHEGVLHVIGVLSNRDALPIDTTITATVLAPDGTVLATTNAGYVAAHQLRPGEHTPFRITFDHLDAKTPDGTALADAEIGSVRVSARGTVSARGLDRNVTLERLTVSSGTVDGLVRNDGDRAALVPRLLVAHYDRAGTLVWVDSHFVNGGLNPLARRPVSFEVTPDAELERLGVPVVVEDNTDLGYPPTPDAGRLRMGAGSVAVRADAFEELP